MDFFISAELRNTYGKRSNYKLRKEKKVPGVIYFSGISISICFSYSYVNEIIKELELGNKLFNIHVGNEKYFVILKDFSKHPFNGTILHFDFQKIELNQIVFADVFFKFVGEKNAIGVRHGGFLIKHKLFVEVSCLASNLPKFIEVDVSKLDVNKCIFLSDLKIDAAVKIPLLNNKNKSRILVASIIGSRVLEQKAQEVKAK